MNEIKGFVTSFGQSIIGVVKSETDSVYELTNVLAVGLQQTGQDQYRLQWGALIPFADDSAKGIYLKIPKNSVIEFALKADVKQEYENLTSTIAVAPASALVSLDQHRKK